MKKINWGTVNSIQLFILIPLVITNIFLNITNRNSFRTPITSPNKFSIINRGGNGVLIHENYVFTGTKKDILTIARVNNFSLESQPFNDSLIILTVWSKSLNFATKSVFVHIENRWERVSNATPYDPVTVKNVHLKKEKSIWYLIYDVFEEQPNGMLERINTRYFIRDSIWRFYWPSFNGEDQGNDTTKTKSFLLI